MFLNWQAITDKSNLPILYPSEIKRASATIIIVVETPIKENINIAK